jgi:hypothetical protein
MAVQITQPDNTSFLAPTGFQFSIQKLPHVNYFCYSANIPDMTLGQVDSITNTFIKLPVPGDKEIYDWMTGLGYPDNFDQSSAIRTGIQAQGSVYSDATLLINTASNRPNVQVSFVDAYPVSLSALQFDVAQADITYLEADVSFVYRKYNIDIIQ